MKKLSILVLSAMLGVSGLAALPAMAATTITAAAPKVDVAPSCNSGRFDEFQKNPDLVAGMLKSDGVSFSSLTEWNGCLKTTTADASGHTVMSFYDPTSLKLIATIG